MARLAALMAVILTVVGALDQPLPVALATHTLTTATPEGSWYPPTSTPTPYQAPSSYPVQNNQQSGAPWLTPAPYGGVPYPGSQPYPGATPYPGSAPPPQYGAPVPNVAPGSSGAPDSSSVQSTGAPIDPPGAPPPGLPGSIISASPGPSSADPCYGDEAISYSPVSPRVGNELLIAVTSSRPHPYGRLAGTEMTRFVRERPGQQGLVWEWIVQPTYPGQHEYTFYVDSTIPCKKVQIQVGGALATRTPTPTKTATPWGRGDNGNGNGNSNGNSNNNDNNAFTTATPTPTIYYDVGRYLGQGDKYGCRDFPSQAYAQAVLRADSRDPNQLDINPRDGIACSGAEAVQDGVSTGILPPPYDMMPVPR